MTTMDDPDWILNECGEKPVHDFTIVAWPPIVAERMFLGRFEELTA